MCLGVPGQIIAIDDSDRSVAIVEVSSVRRRINLACVLNDAQPPESLVGGWVLVHVGFAMNLIDADEARKTLELLSELQSFADEQGMQEAGIDEIR
ncbi:HypC/HybG/HupF family hydrogenase formation chaperone [Marinobacterium sediminicola]|uniref:Hydrogenase maturation protein HypC n=1 Tax=Marinobacterium sediminicola TaxID=518898 RepID=A0ABY1RXD1_9GAMM|nr:HypC/HybG/HupF family hydrogenase formation chaperone [Marinobacterium sediminicola]ULG67765.1 HypC/HybG/HupF family hydrogenase formation chaperone [Marinobacterium sediminicola]SMR71585.1 Hydrogenase maturation protein HypC [Marinobacterium sediminicola]